MLEAPGPGWAGDTFGNADLAFGRQERRLVPGSWKSDTMTAERSTGDVSESADDPHSGSGEGTGAEGADAGEREEADCAVLNGKCPVGHLFRLQKGVSRVAPKKLPRLPHVPRETLSRQGSWWEAESRWRDDLCSLSLAPSSRSREATLFCAGVVPGTPMAPLHPHTPWAQGQGADLGHLHFWRIWRYGPGGGLISS